MYPNRRRDKKMITKSFREIIKIYNSNKHKNYSTTYKNYHMDTMAWLRSNRKMWIGFDNVKIDKLKCNPSYFANIKFHA